MDTDGNSIMENNLKCKIISNCENKNTNMNSNNNVTDKNSCSALEESKDNSALGLLLAYGDTSSGEDDDSESNSIETDGGCRKNGDGRKSEDVSVEKNDDHIENSDVVKVDDKDNRENNIDDDKDKVKNDQNIVHDSNNVFQFVSSELSKSDGHNNVEGSKIFDDMSLTFPRVQQCIDDDAWSLTSSSSSSSSSSSVASASIIFPADCDLSDDENEDDSDTDDSDSDEDSRILQKNNSKNKKQVSRKGEELRTAGELLIDDLPAIKDLHISVPQDECVLLGRVLHIVNKIVTVQALKDLPALNLDTVLFLEWDKPLGRIFDVIGPVTEPMYCIRFNSNEHIKAKDVSVGQPVYFVPKSNHTKYVFLAHLTKMKGSDASWEDNNEPPFEFLDYSDDEQENRAKKLLRRVNVKIEDCEGSDEHEKKRITAFVRKMNRRNLKMSGMPRNQSVKRRSRKKSKQLVRPSTFIPPPSGSDHQNNSAPPQTSGVKSIPHSKTSFLPLQRQNVTNNKQQNCFTAFNSSKRAMSFQSTKERAQQSFQFLSNKSEDLIPNKPPPISPWCTPPPAFHSNQFSTGNKLLPPPQNVSVSHPQIVTGNMTIPPPQCNASVSLPQSIPTPNIFSSPPPCLPNNHVPFNFSPSMLSPSAGAFSSPHLNFSSNQTLRPAVNNFTGSSNNSIQNRSMPPAFSSDNRTQPTNLQFLSTPPPNSSANMFSVPPPTAIPYNSNANNLNTSATNHSPYSFNRNSNDSSLSNNSIFNNFSLFPPVIENRPPQLQGQNRNLQQFQNNFNPSSNLNPPNTRF